MGRIYVPSTPATRGEVVEEDVVDEAEPLTFEEVTAAAEALGFRLVANEPEPEDDSDKGSDKSGPKVEEPAGNASTEAWTDYAKAKGATDKDLVDDKGEALGRDELRTKFGTQTS